MPSQQQINLAAYKAGVTPEEIQRQLTAKGVVSKPPTTDMMDTSTGAPYVAPTVPTTTIPTEPVNIPTNQPVPGSASSIFGTENTFENQYYKNLNDQYNTPIDEEAIRRQKQADYQAQLDSVKAIYADQLNQARVRGQGRQGSSSAIQARRGLLGSNVGEAMTNNIETLNVQEQDLVRQEEANAIAQIQGLIRTGANEEIAARKKAIKEGGESLLAYYAGAGDRKAKKTTDAAKKLLALGKDPSAISDADLATAGIDKNDLLAEFNNQYEAQQEALFKQQLVQEKADLENQKTQAEIDQIGFNMSKGEAELLLKQIETGKAYVAGGFIFDGATNEVIGNAQAVARARSGVGSVGGSRSIGGGNGLPIKPEVDTLISGSRGGKKLPTGATENLSDASYFPGLLNELEGVISENKKYFDPIKGIYYSANPYSGAQTIEDDLKRSSQLIGKFMEGGVLRLEDEKKYAKMLPKLTDTPEVAQNKLEGVRTMLTEKYNGYIRDYAKSGYDVSNYGFLANQNKTPPQNNTQAPSGEDAYAKYLKSIGQ